MPTASSPLHYASTSDGVRIAYVSVGEGFPLVFASNIFGDANRYCGGFPHVKEVTDRLVHLGWRVIRYDHRGMGASDRNVTDLSLAARVRDLVSRLVSLVAFGPRCIPPGGVAPPSNTLSILGRRVLPCGRIAALDANKTYETKH